MIGGTAAGAGNLISGNATQRRRNQWLDRHADSRKPDRARPDRNASPGQPRSRRADRQRFRIQYHRRAGAGGRNFISGNAEGILITGSSTAGTDVAGNLIGTNVEGTAAVGNLTAGIVIAGGTGATIGAPDGPAGNLISGNKGDGIDIGAGVDEHLGRGRLHRHGRDRNQAPAQLGLWRVG